MPINFRSILLAVMTLLLASACTNPQKLIERGDFDGAISMSTRKLSGKKKKKAKYVKALEDGFERATNYDMRKARSLEKENRPENWVEINRIYKKIQRRQELIEPLLPLYSSDGYKADFKFVRVEGLVEKSKKRAAEFYYNEGKRMLAKGRNGNKEAARDAYRLFEHIETYYRRYKDKDELMREAHELGTVYVLFKMKNNSRAILPRDFEREIKRISVHDMESMWRVVHLSPQSGLKYDFDVVMNLRQIDVSPERVKEREYEDVKTIEDGWEYVLDSKGNVLKDSLGNDVKQPRKIEVRARVLEVLQEKSAVVSGELEFYDNHTRKLIHREPITAESIFENYAATFKGDRRALSKESKKKIGNSPLPFPTDEDLVLQAADVLKPIIKSKIRRGLDG